MARLAAMLAVNADTFAQYLHLIDLNTALQSAGGPPSGTVTLAERGRVVVDNLREAPGYLSVAWSFGAQFDPALKRGVVGAAGKADALAKGYEARLAATEAAVIITMPLAA